MVAARKLARSAGLTSVEVTASWAEPTRLVRRGVDRALDVVLCSTRAQTFSPAVFAALGSDLALKTIVVVKSSNHVHAAFALIAAGMISVDCGGSYPPDSVRIPDTMVRQQIWSLDPYPFAAIG